MFQCAVTNYQSPKSMFYGLFSMVFLDTNFTNVHEILPTPDFRLLTPNHQNHRLVNLQYILYSLPNISSKAASSCLIWKRFI